MDARFSEQGYFGPTRVLTAEQCRQFLQAADDPCRAPPLDWAKGHAASSRAFYEIAALPAIVEVVAGLLGDEALLWGASIVDRAPGEAHPWHCDIESSHPTDGTVSVWIGLQQTSPQTTLHIVPGSHRFGVTVQELQFRHGLTRADTTTDDVVRWARHWDLDAGALPLDMTDGEAVFFDGRLWHASHNASGATRRALLLQYARPGFPIRIPDLTSLDWPFRQVEFAAALSAAAGGYGSSRESDRSPAELRGRRHRTTAVEPRLSPAPSARTRPRRGMEAVFTVSRLDRRHPGPVMPRFGADPQLLSASAARPSGRRVAAGPDG
jgi:hypothetical protein